MALAISKYMEITTGLSIRRITDALMAVKDVSLRHRPTGEVEVLRSPLTTEALTILKKLRLSH